ncbi:MAG: hypothetical protein R6V67_05145 [Spirochaetia bacterium]
MDLPNTIRNEIEGLNKELEIISALNTKRSHSDLDSIEIRAAALSLSALYNGIEKVLLNVLKESGSYIKDQMSWHTFLLNESVNSKIISEKTYNELKGFLAFRHFIRHAYSFEINPIAINSILDRAEDLVTGFILEVKKFYQDKSNSYSF